MALTTCGDCGGNLSTEARACPACGRPIPMTSDRKLTIGAIVGLVAFGLFVAFRILSMLP